MVHAAKGHGLGVELVTAAGGVVTSVHGPLVLTTASGSGIADMDPTLTTN